MSTTTLVSSTFRIIQSCGRWRWELVHQNGSLLAQSGATYSRRSDAKRAIERARSALAAAQVA